MQNEDFSMLKGKMGIEDPNNAEQIDKAFEKMKNATVDDVVENTDMSSEEASELKATLTEENVNDIAEVLDENFPEKEKTFLQQAREQAMEDHEGFDVEGSTSINPETGTADAISTNENSNLITETFEEFIANHANDEIDMSVREDTVSEVIKNVTGSEAEASELMEFIDALKKYQDGEINAGETYGSMPTVLKDFTNAQLSQVPMSQLSKYRTTIIKNIIDGLIQDAAFSKYIIDMNNEMTQIYKEFGQEANKFYEESIEDKINTLKEFKESLGDDEQPKKDAIDDILAGLEQSITLEEFKAAAPKIKIKSFYLEKPEKLVRDFNGKYINSKYSIQNLGLIFKVLNSRVGLSEEDCIIFGIAFCLYCKPMRPTNLKEHVFMYYTISNIVSMAALTDEFTATSQKIIDNIKEIVSICKENLTKRGIVVNYKRG